MQTYTLCAGFLTRVARWFVFKPKSHFGKTFQGLGLENVDIFYGHLEYSMTIRYILCSFGTFFPVWVSYTQKKLATLFLST
jgi:hypothetical protein